MSDSDLDPIDELQMEIRASARQRAKNRQAERATLWERLTISLRSDWAVIESSGGVPALNEALDRLVMQSRNRRLFRQTQGDYAAIFEGVGHIAEALKELNEKIAFAFVSTVPASDQRLHERAHAMLNAAADMRHQMDRLLCAAEDFKELVPEQKGGRGSLSDKIIGGEPRFFRDFAEAARSAWVGAGLTLDKTNGFAEFLDAVHKEIFGRDIPNRGGVLAELRSFPKPRIS